MQTEDMKRLLVKDDKSPSGYRIVGYERKIIKTFQQPTFRSTGYTPPPISQIVNEYSYLINNIKGWATKIIQHNAFQTQLVRPTQQHLKNLSLPSLH